MADTGFNLATLWVPVAPETSKIGPAMEQAGREAKGKFGQSVKGIGDTIHQDLAKAASKARDTFTGVSKHISDVFAKSGRDIESTVSKLPGGERFSEPFRKLSSAADGASGSVQSLGRAFGDLKSGDVAGALDRANNSIQGIADSAKNVGVDVEGWTGPINGITEPLSKASETSDQLSGHIKEAKDSVEKLGKSGGGLQGLIGKMGELGIIAASVKESLDAIKDADHWLENRFPAYKSFDEDFKNNPMNRFFRNLFGGDNGSGPTATTDANGNPLFRSGTVTPGAPSGAPGPRQYPNNFVGPIPPGATRSGPAITPRQQSFYSEWYGNNSEPESGPSTPARPDTARGGSYSARLPSVGSGPAGLRTAGSRIAYLYSVAQSLVGTPYSQQLRNDCSGMVSQLAAAALGMSPPSAGERFSTVNEGEWLTSHGFKMGMGRPGDLRIGWYDHGGGNFGHTAATLPGGEHAESGGSHGNFLIGPGAAGADNPEFEHHAYLPMGAAGAGANPAGGAAPLGTEHDPIYVSQTDTESGGSGGPFEQQGQQLAQGMSKGFLELFGIDGSVLKGFGGGKSPLDFGITKLGGGLLNWIGGLGAARAGAGGAAGGDGAMLPGLGGLIPGIGGLIPSRGAAISANTVSTPDGIAGRGVAAAGNTTIINGDVAPFNVHGVGTVQQQKEVANSSNRPQAMATPNAGGMPLP